MYYWTISGVGLNTYKVEERLSDEKAVAFLLEQLGDDPDYAGELEEIQNSGDYSAFDINDYLHGYPFDNFADLLTFCDETDTITYGDNGEGECYFFYPPSMPWQISQNDPKSLEEVHERIIAAVQKITDMTAEQIEALIDDDLQVPGCG